MTTEDNNVVHQAVFGYSDGHRLLASSVQLGSVDTYELAAASDLAPGISLGSSESYLTGLTLPESNLYALVRTWAAPEMQRPGCVWSHVLLLSKNFLSSQIDLGVLTRLFIRPASYKSNPSFAMPLTVGRRERSEPAQFGVVERVLRACYQKFPMDISDASPADLEKAILATWSQQWPRLRSTFLFRSINSTSALPGQTIRFSAREPGAPSKLEPWISVAAEDAVSTSVTPLRRFLWRYGKDIDSGRNPLPDLVKTYMDFRRHAPTYDTVGKLLVAFGENQALTLKRDVLGLSPRKLALVESVNPLDLVKLFIDGGLKEIGVSDTEIASLFQQTKPELLPGLVSLLDEFKGALGEKYQVIFNAVLPLFDERSLISERLPSSVVFEVLEMRPELISDGALRRLSEADLADLLRAELQDQGVHAILRELFRRPVREAEGAIIDHFPAQSLDAAVELSYSDELHSSWRRLFEGSAENLVPLVSNMPSGRAVLATAEILGFPLKPANAPDLWFNSFKEYRAELDTTGETTLLTYIFVLCVFHGLENNRRVAAAVLPDLRSRVISGKLSHVDEQMLGRWLPHYSETWDLNRRLLKLFRQGYKRGSNFDDLLILLNLTSDELAYATNQDPENIAKQVMRAFLPWGWGD